MRMTPFRPHRVLPAVLLLSVLLQFPAESSAAEAVAPDPPTSEDAQVAYSRFAIGFLARLVDVQQLGALSPGKISEINEFAQRQRLRGCDERRIPEPDPFAPAESLRKQDPVTFHCTWESGERISLTRVPNTGSWIVSDDVAAAAGAGMVLAGPRADGPKVAAIPVAPLKEPPVAEPAPEQAAAVASYPVAQQPVFVGASMQAMPSPFVPQTTTLYRPPAASAGPAGPMPTPFSGGR